MLCIAGERGWRLHGAPLTCLTAPHPGLCLVAQSCLTLCSPVDCSLPGSSVHGDSPGKNTGVDCHALLQGIFPTPVLNPGLPYCRQILYCLSYQESPRILERAAFPFLQGIFPNQESNLDLLQCRWILHQLSSQGSYPSCTQIGTCCLVLRDVRREGGTLGGGGPGPG